MILFTCAFFLPHRGLSLNYIYIYIYILFIINQVKLQYNKKAKIKIKKSVTNIVSFQHDRAYDISGTLITDFDTVD